jgi:hypothetical protein
MKIFCSLSYRSREEKMLSYDVRLFEKKENIQMPYFPYSNGCNSKKL